MTPNQATLFFAAAYVVVAVILFLCHKKRNILDVARPISKKTFLKRFGLAVLVLVTGIAGMTGIYLLRLAPARTMIAIGAFQLIISVIADTLLFASWTQRFAWYPRGKQLSLILVLMYVVADLFMPSGMKYAVIIIGTLAALLVPHAWEK